MGVREDLAFCSECRRAARAGDVCPDCHRPCEAPADTYPEKLLETILSEDTSRAGMAVDVLTKQLHEPRAIVPLIILLQQDRDPYPLVLAARGLGWLGDPHAVPALARLLLDENKPFVARIAAAEALGSIGGEEALHALAQAKQSPRFSVARAATRAAANFQEQDRKL
jgi:hypothetical protein